MCFFLFHEEIYKTIYSFLRIFYVDRFLLLIKLMYIMLLNNPIFTISIYYTLKTYPMYVPFTPSRPQTILHLHSFKMMTLTGRDTRYAFGNLLLVISIAEYSSVVCAKARYIYNYFVEYHNIVTIHRFVNQFHWKRQHQSVYFLFDHYYFHVIIMCESLYPMFQK